jgi:hypothetical protein
MADPTPTNVRVGFSTPKRFNPVSWVIRRLTGSRVSHAFLVYRSRDFGEELVIEAHELGFRLLRFKQFQKDNRLVALVEPKVSLDAGLPVVARWIGTTYDYLGLLGTAVVLVGRWLERKWKNPATSAKAVFCSESVVRVMQAVDYPGASKLVPDATTPQDLLDFMTAKDA